MSEVIVKARDKKIIGVKSPVIQYNPPDIVPAAGIQYNSLISGWSGFKTSYDVGDEAWRYGQGHFDDHVLPNPAVVMSLDWNSPDPMRTLLPDNIFGNKNRFTAPDGTQNYVSFAVATYAEPMAIILDHLYGQAMVLPYNQSGFANQSSFQSSRDAALAINEQGYSSFHVMTIKEIKRLADMEGGDAFNKAPFNIDYSGRVLGSSSPRYDNTDEVIDYFPMRGTSSTTLKTANRNYLFIKNIQQTLQP